MPMEYERKFKLASMPDIDLEQVYSDKIEQFYFTHDPQRKLIGRCRKKAINDTLFPITRCYMTIKIGTAGSCMETEFEMPEPCYAELKKHSMIGVAVDKIRYYIKDKEQRVTWEVDSFNTGLIIAEVEHKDPAVLTTLIPPDYFGKYEEVSDNFQYTNFFLAMHGPIKDDSHGGA